MHDLWLECAGRNLSAIAAELFGKCESLRHVNGNRKPRRDATARRRLLIDNLTANLAELALRQTSNTGIAIATKREAKTRYDRPEFPPHLIGAALIDLEQLGYIHRHEGIRNQTRTSIEPTASLRDRIVAEVGINEITRSGEGETIILHASTGVRGRPKPLVDYVDTTETQQLRAEMTTINRHLNSAEITVDGVPAATVHLSRRFQIASVQARHTFDQHGRLYGGFWINMHRTERHRIRIDGEALADLDFTAMFTQLAYLHAGQPLPEGDPYGGFPGLDIIGDDPEIAEARRDGIKRGLNAFYFRTGRMERLPSEVKQALGPEWTATRFAAAARTRHALIKHLFGTGLGIRLMFTESRILVRTLLDLVKVGIVALPIHDGIMVPVSREQEALQVMQDASVAITGHRLPVKAKSLPH